MEAHKIVPDVIDFAPKLIAKVNACHFSWLSYFNQYFVFQIIYPSGVAVNLGNELTPTQVKDQPTVAWVA